MQVLHRNGEDRGRAAPTVSSVPLMPQDAGDPDIIDTELEIRASHITAAAVAAASVTAAVATLAPLPQAAAAPATMLADPAAAVTPDSATLAAAAHAPVVRTVAGGALTLLALMLAWWGSERLPLPAHGIEPVLAHVSLPSLRKPGSVPPPTVPLAVAPVAAAAPTEAITPREHIADLQLQAEARAQELAERRAASQARREREDAAIAAREQRRRDAEVQLADARARAERTPMAAATPPPDEVVVLAEAPPLAEAVRQCNALSLFAREGCLWKLCSGKWGKDGCPSYQRNNEGA